MILSNFLGILCRPIPQSVHQTTLHLKSSWRGDMDRNATGKIWSCAVDLWHSAVWVKWRMQIHRHWIGVRSYSVYLIFCFVCVLPLNLYGKDMRDTFYPLLWSNIRSAGVPLRNSCSSSVVQFDWRSWLYFQLLSVEVGSIPSYLKYTQSSPKLVKELA